MHPPPASPTPPPAADVADRGTEEAAPVGAPGGATLGGNAAITIATQLSVLAFGLIASALISRALGPAGRGAYYVPVTTVMVTFSVLHLSVEMSTTYHFAERLESLRRLARVAATGSIAVGAVGALVLIAPWLIDPTMRIGGMEAKNLALAACALPFVVHSTWMVNLFVLGGRLPKSQLVVVLSAVAQTLALVLLGLLDLFSVRNVLLVYIGTQALTWAMLLAWSRSFAPAVPTRDGPLVRRVVVHGLKMHTAFVAFFLLLRSDVFLVNELLSLEEVGLYSLVVLFAELVWTVAASLAVAALPFQSVEDQAAGGAATLRTVRICLFVAGSLSLACVSTLWFILPLVYGRDFSGVYGPMVTLLPGICALTVVRPMWNWLLREGRSKRINVLFLGGFTLNIVLNVVLLPQIGLYGASVASSISYGIIAAVLASWVLGNTGGRPRDLVPGRDELAAALGLARRLLRRGAAPARPAAPAG